MSCSPFIAEDKPIPETDRMASGEIDSSGEG